jgi:DNA-binding LytR/AlgR family response regulator
MSEVMRCLIVDDEAPARDELRFLLDGLPDVQVVGAAATAEEAEMLLDAVVYDVVFLDIRMPGSSGLELAARLAEVTNRPEIVFTTAYPDHAVEAFELSAADYLLKPFDSERLAQALERVSARRSEGQGPGRAAPVVEEPPGQPRRLTVRNGDRTMFISEDDVVAVSAARGYCYLTLSNERVLASYNLAELEERLSSKFIRPHRSHLVNLERVAEIRSDYRGGLTMIMDDASSTVVPISRRMGPEVRKQLGL